jgi:hypothetical protein
MRFRYLITVVLVLFAAVWATAQSIAINKVTPMVIAGENVGFRVEDCAEAARRLAVLS